MKVRLAEIEDVPGICKLYNEFFIYNSTQQPQYYQKAIETGKYPKSVIENNTEDIFVAIDDNIIVGLIHIIEEETPPYDCFIQHRYANIIDLFVTKDFRGKGIGGRLLETAKQWAKERELDYIELNVLSENKSAMQFYLKEKFNNVSQIMRYTL